jgi:hypothetical protein
MTPRTVGSLNATDNPFRGFSYKQRQRDVLLVRERGPFWMLPRASRRPLLGEASGVSLQRARELTRRFASPTGRSHLFA